MVFLVLIDSELIIWGLAQWRVQGLSRYRIKFMDDFDDKLLKLKDMFDNDELLEFEYEFDNDVDEGFSGIEGLLV